MNNPITFRKLRSIYLRRVVRARIQTVEAHRLIVSLDFPQWPSPIIGVLPVSQLNGEERRLKKLRPGILVKARIMKLVEVDGTVQARLSEKYALQLASALSSIQCFTVVEGKVKAHSRDFIWIDLKDGLMGMMRANRLEGGHLAAPINSRIYALVSSFEPDSDRIQLLPLPARLGVHTGQWMPAKWLSKPGDEHLRVKLENGFKARVNRPVPTIPSVGTRVDVRLKKIIPCGGNCFILQVELL